VGAMRMLRSFEFLTLMLLLVVAGAYWWHYAPHLPERIPTHFNGRGVADGWTGREGFVWFYWGIIGGVVTVFLLLSALILKAPASLINLPRHDFWLAPEREEETRLELVRRLLTLADATVIFYLVLTHLSVRSALDESGAMGPEFNWILGIYLAYVAVWTGLLLRHFSRTPSPR